MTTYQKIRRIILVLTILLTIILGIVSIAGFFGYYGWIYDIFSNFRFQYTLAAATFLLIFIAFRKFRWSVITFVILVMNLVEIYPYLSILESEKASCELKTSAINVLSINRNSEAVINYIQKEDPDIIILQEYTNWWEEEMSDFKENYKFHYEINRSDDFGMAIFSKLEPVSIEVMNFSEASVPSILTSYQIDNKRINVLATHPVPPATEEMFNDRNKQLAKIGELKPKLGDYYIVAGDLNVTPFSYYFKKMKSQLDLEEARENRGINATWPTLPWPISIPIDHILVAPSMEVTSFSSGELIGSDHHPVTACISF